MRIVAGSAKGRVLNTPKSDDVIRPTADRVRETIFNVLGQWCEGLNVLDLYAGTGALAFEALSRGATHAVLVDSGKEAQQLIRLNIESLKFTGQAELLTLPAFKALESLAAHGKQFDLVFADPPYKQEVCTKLMEQLASLSSLVRPGGRVVLEREKKEALAETFGPFTRIDERTFGLTTVAIFELTQP
jgi:16S rRNA (guanine(966)-N(2))-methyltransferase RsmD